MLFFAEFDDDEAAIPLYLHGDQRSFFYGHFRNNKKTHKYFISTSNASTPPSLAYTRASIGLMSAWRIDCRISTTAAACSS